MPEQVSDKQNKVLWWLPAMLVVALGLGVWSWVAKESTNTNNTNVANHNTNVATSYRYPGQDGKNALELLKTTYPNTTTKTSGSLGEQVMSINGIEAKSNEYWEFLVNGAAASVGAGAYVTKSTDTITWKLTSF
jgi:hypothetical protein